MDEILIQAGNKREGIFKEKGKEKFKITIEAIEDVTYKDFGNLLNTISNPDEVTVEE